VRKENSVVIKDAKGVILFCIAYFLIIQYNKAGLLVFVNNVIQLGHCVHKGDIVLT
jgi:hypothetical protein